MLDRRSVPQLTTPKLLFDAPTGAPIVGRVKILALKDGNGAIGGAFTPAWHARQRLLGSMAKSIAGSRLERTGQR